MKCASKGSCRVPMSKQSGICTQHSTPIALRECSGLKITNTRPKGSLYSLVSYVYYNIPQITQSFYFRVLDKQLK